MYQYHKLSNPASEPSIAIVSRIKIVICCFIIFQSLPAQIFKLPEVPTLDDFIVDTLYVEIPTDSVQSNFQSNLQIEDTRELAANILDIQQTNKYKVIPVDQLIALKRPLPELFKAAFVRDSLAAAGTLYISEIKIWYDNKPAFAKGRRLNAYTILYDEEENLVSDWLWEITVDKVRKEQEADQLGRMVTKWLDQQSRAIKARDFNQHIYPYLYRRQLMVWNDMIIFSDGFAVNAHLTLDFPPGYKKKWVRGTPGVYFRKAAHHESIAIGGVNQQWHLRISTSWLVRLSGTFRFGFNNFDSRHYSQVDYWNIVLINFSSLFSLDYRPVYQRGLIAGIGVFNSYHILPDVVARDEVGLSVTVGIILP